MGFLCVHDEPFHTASDGICGETSTGHQGGMNGMTRTIPRLSAALVLGALICSDVGLPRDARAGCSNIPAPPVSFRGAKGTVDRPFVIPGDTGGPADSGGRVTLILDACQPAAAVFDPNDHVVALIFTPPSGGARNALLLTKRCDDSVEKACEAQLQPNGKAACVPTTLHVEGGGKSGDDRLLWFDMPKITAASGLSDLAGPAAIVVTGKSSLRCDVGGQTTPTCKSDTTPASPLVCIDDFFVDPGCGLSFLHPEFGNFTVLPTLNDFQKLCKDEGAAPNCVFDETKAEAVRFAIDKRGNVLLPVNWRGVLRAKGSPTGAACTTASACDTRKLRGKSRIDPFLNDPAKDVIKLPSGVVKSFSVRGAEFVPPPEITVGLTNPGSPDQNELLLEGEAHKAKSVVRIPSCDETVSPCVPNSLFNFTDRLANQVGPVTVPRKGGPGICDEPGGKKCTSDANCGSGVACAGVRAFALGHLSDPMPRPTPAAATSLHSQSP